jgi:hypothetical protein
VVPETGDVTFSAVKPELDFKNEGRGRRRRRRFPMLLDQRVRRSHSDRREVAFSSFDRSVAPAYVCKNSSAEGGRISTVTTFGPKVARDVEAFSALAAGPARMREYHQPWTMTTSGWRSRSA